MQTSVPHIDELANMPNDEPKMAVTLGRNVKRLRERYKTIDGKKYYGVYSTLKPSKTK